MRRAAELRRAARGPLQSLRGALLKRHEAGEDVAAEVRRQAVSGRPHYLEEVEKLVQRQRDVMAETKTQAEKAAMFGTAALALGGTLALLLAGIMAWLLTRSIVTPIQRAAAVADAIAAGDLTQTITVEGQDEAAQLLRSLQRMQGALQDLVSQMRSSTDSIGTATDEIAAGNKDLSARTEQAASSLQQTASSMEQLTGTVRQSADSARHANQLASSAADVAQRGGQVVSQVVDTMGQISTSSKRIGDIIGVIDGHCLPDQHPGAERGGGSRPRRRAGPRLRGGGQRGAQPGPALGRCRP